MSASSRNERLVSQLGRPTPAAASDDQQREMRSLQLVAWASIAAGIVLRSLIFVAPTRPLLTCDGRAYHLMAVSLVNGRGFYLDDPDLALRCSGFVAGPSHHFSPGLPIIESVFVGVLGDTALSIAVPVALLSLLAVGVTWWTTRDLYGELAGLLAAAAISLQPTGILYGTLFGYAENLILIALVLTLWAVLRGLRNDRFIPLAGVFAAVGYLGKASIGWFFLIAGFGGVLWRTWFHGWRGVVNRWYLIALGLFAVPVAAWSFRNLSLFWDGTLNGLIDGWQTSNVVSRYVAVALNDPAQLALGLVGKLPVLLVLFSLPFIPLRASLRTALAGWRDEEAFGLWMTIALIFALGGFFAAVMWVNEGTNLLWPDPLRYVAPAQVPLLWLVLRQSELPSQRNWKLVFLTLGVMAVVLPYLVPTFYVPF